LQIKGRLFQSLLSTLWQPQNSRSCRVKRDFNEQVQHS